MIKFISPLNINEREYSFGNELQNIVKQEEGYRYSDTDNMRSNSFSKAYPNFYNDNSIADENNFNPNHKHFLPNSFLNKGNKATFANLNSTNYKYLYEDTNNYLSQIKRESAEEASSYNNSRFEQNHSQSI